MKKLYILSLLAMVFVLIGCAPTIAGNEPTVPEVGADESTDSAEVVITQADAQSSEQALTVVETSEEARGPEAVESEDSAGPVIVEDEKDDEVMAEPSTEAELVEPVTVNMSELTPVPPTDTEPREMPRPGGPNPQDQLAWSASQDLALRLGIDVSEVAIVTTEETQWADSSLGCPQAGYSYMMVITDGFVVTLSAQGQEYTYHTNANDAFVLCSADGTPVE